MRAAGCDEGVIITVFPSFDVFVELWRWPGQRIPDIVQQSLNVLSKEWGFPLQG
jgi:hypothetical protein